MRHIWINVSIEAILVRSRFHPTRYRHFFHQVYFHYGLDALKSILPGHNKANWGSILWGESIGVTGEDYTTLFGFGTIDSVDRLGVKAVERLLRTWWNTAGMTQGTSTLPRPVKKGPVIALLPFENMSRNRNAGWVVFNVFVSGLIQDDHYRVVEPGESRAKLIQFQVRSLSGLGLKTLGALGRELGADYIVLGSVTDFREQVKNDFPPRVTMYARMLEVSKGRLVWAGNIAMTGDDSLIVLDFGKIRAIVPLVKKATDSIIASMKKAKINRLLKK